MLAGFYLRSNCMTNDLMSNETVDDIDREAIQIKLRQIKAFSNLFVKKNIDFG